MTYKKNLEVPNTLKAVRTASRTTAKPTALVDFAPWFASSKILDVVGLKHAWSTTGEREPPLRADDPPVHVHRSQQSNEQIDKNRLTEKSLHLPVTPESYPMSQKTPGALSNPCTGIITRALEHSLTTRSKQQRRTGSLFDSPAAFPSLHSRYAPVVTNAPSAFQIFQRHHLTL